MRFGILYAYWTREWSGDYLYYAKKVKELGFDILEISAGDLLRMHDSEISVLRDLSKSLDLEISCNIGPPKQYDVASSDPAVRAAGIQFLTDIMKKMDLLDSRTLVGVMYTYWPNDFTDLDKPALWSRGVESCQVMGKTAQALGINMCLEVVNRFETPVLNTAEEAVRFCHEVGNPNVQILLDTFHMNIEEDNQADAIRTAGTLLGHLHVGEGNRKLPGQGSLPWGEIGQALRDIGYTGGVVMEPFVLQGGQVGRDIKVWRDLSGGADEKQLDRAAAAALETLKRNFL
ncbi:sugar phosphate isomerase/epimerase family protein [Yeguia hominis]|uniref:Sugar phosphate isomerase/epimerase n=1 Tax=Yeguia hominis TaxID=2763662 RepID=A0A926DBI6_9FIRM|nr:sugar phosphate isomerase/epimerase [Yeguia hominis]MBC8534832.1 sugar phosphate isomerase/epimerase [Yeguia hominis]